MPITRIKPDSVHSTPYPPLIVRTGGSTTQGVLSDASDSTYVRKLYADGGRPILVTGLGSYSLASGSDIVAVRAGAKYKQLYTVYPAMLALGLSVEDVSGTYIMQTPREALGYAASATEKSLAWWDKGPMNAELTAANINALRLLHYDTAAATDTNRATFYESFVDVYALPRPTVSVASDDGSTVSLTSTPRFTVTVSKVVESWETGTRFTEGDVELQIFSQAQYEAVGFDPSVTAPSVAYNWDLRGHGPLAYDDGSTPSTIALTFTSQRLPKSGTFRAYAMARHYGVNAQYGTPSYVEFTMAVDPTLAPTVAATVSGQTVEIEVLPQSKSGHASPYLVDIERSDDVGVTWTPVYDGTDVEGTFNAVPWLHTPWASDSGVEVDPILIASHDQVQATYPTNQGTTAKRVVYANTPVGSFVEGDAVTFALDIKGSCTPESTVKLTIQPLDAAGSAIGSLTAARLDDPMGIDDTVFALWSRQHVHIASLPAGTSRVQVALLMEFSSGTYTGFTWDLRDPMVEPTATESDYVDGYVLLVDHVAPRATALKYRARATIVLDGESIASDWGTVDVTGSVALSGWNIKAPLSPELNVIDAQVLADPEYKQAEDVSVLRPIGRERAVVVSGALGGSDATLTLRASTSAEWTALEAIRQYQGPLYIESPFGWARYVRVIERAWAENGPASAPKRALNLSVVEVDEP